MTLGLETCSLGGLKGESQFRAQACLACVMIAARNPNQSGYIYATECAYVQKD